MINFGSGDLGCIQVYIVEMFKPINFLIHLVVQILDTMIGTLNVVEGILSELILMSKLCFNLLGRMLYHSRVGVSNQTTLKERDQ